MAFDETTAKRIRKLLPKNKDIEEKNMFGGLSFLLKGKMFCGIIKKDLVVRVGKELYEKALVRPHTRPMDFTGHPIKGFVYVSPAGFKADADLKNWIKLGIDYSSTLQSKI